MPDLQLTFDVGSADPAPIEEALTSLGATSVTLEDAADNPVLEPAPGETPLWPTIRIRALFQADADRASHRSRSRRAACQRRRRFASRCSRTGSGSANGCVTSTRCASGAASGSARMARLPETRRRFAWRSTRGSPLARGLTRRPPSASSGSMARSFAGCRVIDYGCGSGILAIAALKLGAAEALAFDIDPQARLATRDNAVRNGVADRLTVAATAPQQGCVLRCTRRKHPGRPLDRARWPLCDAAPAWGPDRPERGPAPSRPKPSPRLTAPGL